MAVGHEECIQGEIRLDKTPLCVLYDDRQIHQPAYTACRAGIGHCFDGEEYETDRTGRISSTSMENRRFGTSRPGAMADK